MVIMAVATTDIATTEINPHLVFNPQKNQFKFEQWLKHETSGSLNWKEMRII